MRLAGKIGIITGAARGIGAAMSTAFTREGARLILVDRLEAPLHLLAETLQAAGAQVQTLVADIATSDGNDAAVESARSQFGGLDCFVANAAIQRFGNATSTSSTDWDDVQRVNLKGAFLGSKAAIPELIRRGGGSIIFTASVLGIVGDADLVAYGAAKGGLRALCRSIAAGYGPAHIRCNTLCPADVRTELFEEYVARSKDPDGEIARLTALYPLGRIATTWDIAAAAVFLASDDSSFISGTDLIIDGGLLAKVY